jgi:peptidoglycan hydrolase CwlO-like protein
MDPDLVTLKQAAETLDIPKDRIRGWIRRGRLVSAKIDGVHMVDIAAVAAVVNETNADANPVDVLSAQIETMNRFETMNREWLGRLDAERERSQSEYESRVIAETQNVNLRTNIERLQTQLQTAVGSASETASVTKGLEAEVERLETRLEEAKELIPEVERLEAELAAKPTRWWRRS